TAHHLTRRYAPYSGSVTTTVPRTNPVPATTLRTGYSRTTRRARTGPHRSAAVSVYPGSHVSARIRRVPSADRKSASTPAAGAPPPPAPPPPPPRSAPPTPPPRSPATPPRPAREPSRPPPPARASAPTTARGSPGPPPRPAPQGSPPPAGAARTPAPPAPPP